MKDALLRRYEQAAHAMQTGVAFEQTLNPLPTQPKHLRVGVNMALCGEAAMAQLLIRKGIITEEEYDEALVEAVEAEAERYRTWLAAQTGKTVHLI